mmetsp:Transcript_7471/g.20791  ORF Transcript_7471/g.20791 Transcript_7471/m.20791 type:complete len:398 (-) Transcript_7471:50-1243(-)
MVRSTMKAAHVTSWCTVGTVADTIVIGDVPTPPPPRARQVTVRVRAAAINVDDVALLQDTAGGGRFFHAARPTSRRPLIGGCEFAGEVVAVGPDVQDGDGARSGIRVGDRVCGVQDVAGMSGGGRMTGTWAEFTVVPSDRDLARLPDGLSFREAAASGMAAHVVGDMMKRADSCLRVREGTSPTKHESKGEGESPRQCRCLVIGASGGLGTVLLQLLRRRDDVHTVAVCSASNAATVRRLGADEVVDYTAGPLAEQLADAPELDVVFDFVGGTDTERSAAALLRRGGMFLTAVGPWQNLGDRRLSWCEWMGWACGLSGRLVRGNSHFACCMSYRYSMSMELLPLNVENFHTVVVDGEARGEIAMEVPFTETALRDAIQRVATRHSGGKVIINMDLPT